MKEIWRDIKGHKGYYKASNAGRIKSLGRTIKRSDGKIQVIPESILVGDINNCGYRRVRLFSPGKSKRYFVHRLIAKTFVPNPGKLRIVNHKDGNKLNNRSNNVEWSTYSKNGKHAYDTGLNKHLVGEEWHSAKLTERQVLRIRDKYAQGVITQESLATQYGVSRRTIGFIIKRQRWKHI